jgi:hypothetical protein
MVLLAIRAVAEVGAGKRVTGMGVCCKMGSVSGR